MIKKWQIFEIIFITHTALFAQGIQREIQLQSTTAPYGFVEYLPEGYDDSKDQTYPLVVFLHGLGETGNGNDQLNKLRIHGPHKLVDNGRSFNAIILSPQSISWWDIAKIDQFVEWAFENYSIDQDYFYMTGLSMGGGGTWLYARDYPQKLAAIVPICGAADVSHPENLIDIPVWAFHNDGDPVVKVKLTYDWINGMRSSGGSPLLTIYHANSHDAWTTTYNNEEMWDWMFSYKRGEYLPTPLEISTKEIMDTIVYPNPIDDYLIIENSLEKIHAIYLSDLAGKVIDQWTQFKSMNHQIKIDLKKAGLNTGIYLLHLQFNDHTSVIRLEKQ